MILVGQYDSFFVRRVAVALHLYGVPFTRDRTSVFSDEMARVNPLVRIPSLVLDDGEILHDSAAILEHLDEQVAPEKALMPRAGAERRRVMQATVMATGAGEKAGAVVYERIHHPGAMLAVDWVTRCLRQLGGALEHLDHKASSPWFFGERITQADVSLGCVLGYLDLRLHEAFPPRRYPRLEACKGSLPSSTRKTAPEATVRAPLC
jgi:glutathione S-transferase